MFYLIIITIISGIIAGMGIGGGSVFILLTTIFGIFSQQIAQGYNLFMFIVVGIVATIFNLIKKNLDVKLLLKLIFPMCLGSIIGITILKNIDQNILKIFFYCFMLIIALYEIISSLKNIISAKNNKMKGVD